MIASHPLEQKILAALPYRSPFLFTDKLHNVDDNSITGSYTFRKDEYFYAGHFKHIPVTPGVILTECMGQIGMVSHLIYLLKLYENPLPFYPLLTHMEVDFLKRVMPENNIFVTGKRVFYRNDTLRSVVEMHDGSGQAYARAKFLLRFIFD